MSSFCIEVKETERAKMHNTVKHEYVVICEHQEKNVLQNNHYE